jgi:hypothetical protein
LEELPCRLVDASEGHVNGRITADSSTVMVDSNRLEHSFGISGCGKI